MPSPTPRADMEKLGLLMEFVTELSRKHRTFPRRRGLCWACYTPHPCATRVALDELLAQVNDAKPDTKS